MDLSQSWALRMALQRKLALSVPAIFITVPHPFIKCNSANELIKLLVSHPEDTIIYRPLPLPKRSTQT